MRCLATIRRLSTLAVLPAVLLVAGPRPAAAASPPDPPVITEPQFDGAIVSADDVHMETGPMSDPDPGDTHLCTDWEIWLAGTERVWRVACATGLGRTHVHLGDGVFEGSHAGRNSLVADASYRLRVRHRDSTGSWSDYAERLFYTAPAFQVFPLELDDVAVIPAPSWGDREGPPIILPADPSAGLRMESPAAELLLEIRGLNGTANNVTNPPALGRHVVVRVRVDAGNGPLALPRSRLAFSDGGGSPQALYLPALGLVAGSTAWFWIAEDGSSYWGNEGQTEPDFTQLAEGAPAPWVAAHPGYQVEVVASGFQLPVSLAFVPNPGIDPDDPFFYVTELYGKIKVVTRDLTVRDYATGLLNFDPTGDFPGSGEQGLAGIVVDPATGDVYAGMLYDAAPPSGPHYPKVVRFTSDDGGLTAATQTTILDMPGETQGTSHFISDFSIGPDGMLYVHMGDGFDPTTALNLDSFRGKILRMTLNGAAPSDNPFFDGPPFTARDYVYAYGFRNPFGGAWRAADGHHYEVENGPGANDRFARVLRGEGYGWDGGPESMKEHALYTWPVPHAPVDLAFIEPESFGGSGFPPSRQGNAFVTESGPTYAPGPQPLGKRIVEFAVSPGDTVQSGPATFVEYRGSGRATACGIAAGPDGLYFTDLYKDQGAQSPTEPGANVLRVRYVGTADFTADYTFGYPSMVVNFTDLSDVPGAQTWAWSFGDGGVSHEQNPRHTYTAEGAYDVRLEVAGSNGLTWTLKRAYILVGNANAIGLRGDYFDAPDFGAYTFSRIDPVIRFWWDQGSPDPRIVPNEFSVRWTGQVEAVYSEEYTFHTITDDGVRLWVDNVLLIDHWDDQGPTEHRGTALLQAGERYDIRLEYYENRGGAVAQLDWSSPSQPRQTIPASRLYPPFPVASVEAGSAAAPRLSLSSIRAANPLRGSGTYLLRSRDRGRLRLTLFDVGGREVDRLFDGDVEAGATVPVGLDGARYATGMYFLRAEGGGTKLVRKVTIVR